MPAKAEHCVSLSTSIGPAASYFSYKLLNFLTVLTGFQLANLLLKQIFCLQVNAFISTALFKYFFTCSCHSINRKFTALYFKE